MSSRFCWDDQLVNLVYFKSESRYIDQDLCLCPRLKCKVQLEEIWWDGGIRGNWWAEDVGRSNFERFPPKDPSIFSSFPHFLIAQRYSDIGFYSPQTEHKLVLFLVLLYRGRPYPPCKPTNYSFLCQNLLIQSQSRQACESQCVWGDGMQMGWNPNTVWLQMAPRSTFLPRVKHFHHLTSQDILLFSCIFSNIYQH